MLSCGYGGVRVAPGCPTLLVTSSSRTEPPGWTTAVTPRRPTFPGRRERGRTSGHFLVAHRATGVDDRGDPAAANVSRPSGKGKNLYPDSLRHHGIRRRLGRVRARPITGLGGRGRAVSVPRLAAPPWDTTSARPGSSSSYHGTWRPWSSSPDGYSLPAIPLGIDVGGGLGPFTVFPDGYSLPAIPLGIDVGGGLGPFTVFPDGYSLPAIPLGIDVGIVRT